MSELEPRQQILLKAIILEYVSGAEPVASDLLVVKYDLGVKSATVRNELAEMSERGFLEQPHTSAGRIPSDKGYRFYIDHLYTARSPETEEKSKLKQATDDGEALQHLLKQTTRALSRVTHLMSVATTARDADLTIKSAVVSAFGPQQALVVLGLSNGDVHNRLIECPVGLTLQDVGAINELLLREIVGKSIQSGQRTKVPAAVGPASFDQLLSATWTALKSMFRDLTRGTLVTHGEEFLFGQPEFSRNAAHLSGLLEQLKESDVLFDALAHSSESATPVTIGKEHRHEELHKLSVVRQSFFVGQQEAGTIAVIGPTRMNYDFSIPVVQFTARALTEALTRFAG